MFDAVIEWRKSIECPFEILNMKNQPLDPGSTSLLSPKHWGSLSPIR